MSRCGATAAHQLPKLRVADLDPVTALDSLNKIIISICLLKNVRAELVMDPFIDSNSIADIKGVGNDEYQSCG
jgi:hypothetical protein